MLVIRTLLLVTVILLSGCGNPAVPPPSTIDPAMAACIPAGTNILAGVDLDRLRTSPLYARLPPSVQALQRQFQTAHSLLAVSRGADLLLITSPGLALTGSPDLIAAAEAQRKKGVSGAPDLVKHAAEVAAGRQIWVVARGDVPLPLTGNAANLNHLLRNMEYAALTVHVDSTVEFAIAARGRSPEAARRFEQTLRAAITMTAAGEAKHPDLAALLRSIQVQRQDRTVHAGFSSATDAAQHLLEMLLN